MTLTGSASIKGNVTTKSLYLNSGNIEGDVIAEGTVIIAEQSRVKGSITAESLKTAGSIEGNVTVKGHSSLASTATVLGDVASESISIDSGAILNGRYSTLNKNTNPASKPITENPID